MCKLNKGIRFVVIGFVFVLFMVLTTSNVQAYTGTVGAKYCGDNFKFYKTDGGFFRTYVYKDTEEIDDNFSVQWVTGFSSGTSNRKAYCIEKGRKINKVNSKYSAASNGNVDDGDYINANIARAIAYGQEYDTSAYNGCTNARVATSTLVQMINANKEKDGVDYWRTVKKSTVKGAIKDGTDGEKISDYFIKIRNKVLEHRTAPKLNALDSSGKTYATYTAYTTESSAKANPINYVPYLTSTKKFHETFDLGLDGDWDWTVSKILGASYVDNASISNNTLSVTMNQDFPGNMVCLKIGKKVRTGKAYFTSLNTQDTAVLYDGDSDTKYYYTCFKENYVKVTKQDASTKKLLNDFQFRLFDTKAKCEDSSRVDDDTTNAMGTHGEHFTTHKTGGNFSKGDGTTYFYHVKENSTNSYWVREMYPPSGYQISGAVCREVKVNDSTGVTFEDDQISSSSIKVSKLNSYDGTPIYNVRIGLYSDSNCSTLATGYGIDSNIKATGASGTVFWNIDTTGHQDEILKFYVKEVATPSGYIKDTSKTTCHPVTIKASNSTVTEVVNNTAVIYNEPYGNIKLLKQNSVTKKPVKGITFTLLDEKKNPAKDKDGKTVSSASTDDNGFITFKNLRYGKYFLQEKNENTAYKEIKDPIEIILNKNTDAIILKNNVAEKYKIGDVNNDAAINADDANELAKIIGDTTLLGESVIKRYASDIDGNGIIDSTDKKLLDKYLGVSNYSSAYNTFSNKYKGLCTATGNKSCNLSYSVIMGTYNVYLDNKVTDTGSGSESAGTSEGTATGDSGSDSSETPVTYKLGDVNKNGKIDSEDVTEIAKCIGSTTCSDEVIKLGDVNKNGQLDSNDRASVENYLVYANKEAIYTAMKAYLDARNTICDQNCDFNDKELETVLNIGKNGTIPKEVTQSSLVVFNEPIDMKISKQDITTQAEIPGATIVIKDESGKEILKFTSTEDPKEFNISAGKYTLVETIAPKGYNDVETTITFEVQRDGDVKILKAEKNMAKVIVSDIEYDVDTDHLIVYNVSLKEKIIKKKKNKVTIPDTASNITFLSIVIGGSLVLGGGYVLYKRYKVS
ncbi:MAG: SpaA isopeptide-forming pilin-related protein [bacterium]|nr:SpaA isopeptide-forming pilin-related protein [bacterium]